MKASVVQHCSGSVWTDTVNYLVLFSVFGDLSPAFSFQTNASSLAQFQNSLLPQNDVPRYQILESGSEISENMNIYNI